MAMEFAKTALPRALMTPAWSATTWQAFSYRFTRTSVSITPRVRHENILVRGDWGGARRRLALLPDVGHSRARGNRVPGRDVYHQRHGQFRARVHHAVRAPVGRR